MEKGRIEWREYPTKGGLRNTLVTYGYVGTEAILDQLALGNMSTDEQDKVLDVLDQGWATMQDLMYYGGVILRNGDVWIGDTHGLQIPTPLKALISHAGIIGGHPADLKKRFGIDPDCLVGQFGRTAAIIFVDHCADRFLRIGRYSQAYRGLTIEYGRSSGGYKGFLSFEESLETHFRNLFKEFGTQILIAPKTAVKQMLFELGFKAKEQYP